MEYIKDIQQFKPSNDQEDADKRVILNYIQEHRHNVLLRDNPHRAHYQLRFFDEQTLGQSIADSS